MGKKDKKIRVLFICTYHGSRSKIAEEYLNRFSQGKVEAFCSSFESSKVGDLAIQVMKEENIHLSGERIKLVFDRYRDKETFDYVVSICHDASSEQCPIFMDSIDALYPQRARRIYWSIPDFKSVEGSREKILAHARKIREQIKENVKGLLEDMLNGSSYCDD